MKAILQSVKEDFSCICGVLKETTCSLTESRQSAVLQAENAAVQAQRKHLEAEIAKLEAEKQVAALSSEVNECRTEIVSLQKRIESLEESNRAEVEKTARWQTEAVTLRARLDESESSTRMSAALQPRVPANTTAMQRGPMKRQRTEEARKVSFVQPPGDFLVEIDEMFKNNPVPFRNTSRNTSPVQECPPMV